MEWYNLAEKIWSNKFVYYWITFIYGSMNILPIATLDWGSKKFWVICFLLLIGYISLIYVVHLKRRYPKFSKEAYGILFAIDVENEEQYKLINKKFVMPFQSHCGKQLPNIETQMLNVFCCKDFCKFKQDKEKLKRLAEKKHYKFIIYGNSYFGNEKEELDCKLEIDGFCNLHDSMPYNNHLVLSREMTNLWLRIKNIEIYKTSATSDFTSKAEQLELIFKYILAVTFLLCSDVPNANKLFLLLHKELNDFKKNIPVINGIKSVIKSRITCTYLLLAYATLNKYYQNPDKDILLTMKNYLDSATQYDENSYDAKILLGFFHFLYDRDVKKALLVLNECKNEKNITWKQNIAFLKLYTNDTIPNFLNAYKTYKKLYSQGYLTMYNIEEVSTFIHMILKTEPDKKQLYFILFLMYYYVGDEKLADEYYTQFVETYSAIIKNDRINDMLFKIGKSEKIIVA